MSDFEGMLGDSLKSIRDEHVRSIESEVPAARRRIEDKVRRRRFTFVAGGTALAAAAVALAIFVVQTVPDIDRSAPIRPVGFPEIVATIDVPGVAFMDTGLGSLWVTHENGMVEIDPSTGSIGIESPVSPVDGIDLNSEALYAIDTVGGGISRIPYGTEEGAFATEAEGIPTLVAASDEFVWYSSQIDENDSTAIYALDPAELEYLHEYEFPGVIAADMTESGGRLWLSVSAEGAGPGFIDEGFNLVEIPPANDNTADVRVVGLSADEGSPAQVTVGGGAVWVLRQQDRKGGNTISRVDIETGEVVDRAVTLPDHLESIAFGEGYLWATTAPTGMNMPDDVRSRLFRVDPNTLQVIGDPLEVAGPGSKLAVGEGFVWVGDPNNKRVVQIDPTGAPSPDPTPSEEPTPNETPDDAAPDRNECSTFIPFESGDPGARLGLGSGGQTDLPLHRQNPEALVHYSLEKGFVDVMAGPIEFFALNESEPIEVLGGRGTIGAIHEGYGVDFSTGGCDFQLLAYGLDLQETRGFAEGLTLRGHGGLNEMGFALWPEPAPEDAYVACLEAGGDDNSYRSSAEGAATVFADEVLEWPDIVISPDSLDPRGEEVTYLRLERTDQPGIEIDVGLTEVAVGCWSVVRVRTVDQDGESYLSVGKNGGKLTVGIDVSHEPAGDTVATLELIVLAGDRRDSDTARLGDSCCLLRVSSVPNEPIGFVILLRDGDGVTVGAIGMPMPSGDFSAG